MKHFQTTGIFTRKYVHYFTEFNVHGIMNNNFPPLFWPSSERLWKPVWIRHPPRPKLPTSYNYHSQSQTPIKWVTNVCKKLSRYWIQSLPTVTGGFQECEQLDCTLGLAASRIGDAPVTLRVTLLQYPAYRNFPAHQSTSTPTLPTEDGKSAPGLPLSFNLLNV